MLRGGTPPGNNHEGPEGSRLLSRADRPLARGGWEAGGASQPLLSCVPFNFTSCVEGTRSLARTPLAHWPAPVAHRWSIQARAETAQEPRVASSLGSAVNLNFKFMVVAFVFM